ncbi:hypothetical protein C8Q77DRAFT_826820 [Trametes polyzona]|nr:hypothetical protein C8Q77DRAFT_826820 [Trametes polyzona]
MRAKIECCTASNIRCFQPPHNRLTLPPLKTLLAFDLSLESLPDTMNPANAYNNAQYGYPAPQHGFQQAAAAHYGAPGATHGYAQAGPQPEPVYDHPELVPVPAQPLFVQSARVPPYLSFERQNGRDKLPATMYYVLNWPVVALEIRDVAVLTNADLKSVVLRIRWPGYDGSFTSNEIPLYTPKGRAILRSTLLREVVKVFEQFFQAARNGMVGRDSRWRVSADIGLQLGKCHVRGLRHCGGNMFEADVLFNPDCAYMA